MAGGNETVIRVPDVKSVVDLDSMSKRVAH